jgi:hypothetical protein
MELTFGAFMIQFTGSFFGALVGVVFATVWICWVTRPK